MNHPSEEDADRYHITATTSLAGETRRVLMHDESFAVLDRHGDVRASVRSEQGLYHGGTRFLSTEVLYLGTRPFLFLSSTVLENNLLFTADLTNAEIQGADYMIPHGTLHVLRSKLLRDATCYERIQLTNYSASAVDFVLRMEFDADYADVFEVRGTRRAKRGVRLPTRIDGGTAIMMYRGLDDVTRTTRLVFTPDPTSLTEREAAFQVHLEAKQTKELFVTVSCGVGGERRQLVAYESAVHTANEARTSVEETEAHIYTANELFNDWLNRSQADLRMMVANTPTGPYPCAGVPWFSVPFGRDGIWTAIEYLHMNPDLAAGVLSFLAANQATSFDPEADAEPGKIVHEMRQGEMASLREVPFGRYYGSVDSTPLFVMLAAEYFDATGDLELVRAIWPNLLAALSWIDGPGDRDGDGFVEYGRKSQDGLVQQGWKDSNDSVFHRDGALAEGPIALCEVQGYVYAARLGMARLAQVLGDDARAEEQTARAAALRENFDRAFWCPELSTYALALDAKKRPCRVSSSNPGHCLFSRIVLPERARALASTLVSPEMFSGWGVRTLATGEERYNPMSYHNGSVWPHDNAITAAGLARYGYTHEAAKILAGLFDASLFMDLHRLPELFCGFPRRPSEAPTGYPVACSPQAWAAAAPFLLLASVLGLRIDAEHHRLIFERPMLPAFVDDVIIRNLRVGKARVDLRVHRYPEDVGVNVLRKTGDVEVILVK
ncbi:MAG TPA: amylo-alpha-1,6-glucosidase [Polyangiaceae bacterium]|jgi:glycogen debranching enzyme|nr:amylo-alpha-1,6-glucosidase [Polyangiaceae bacterium]